MKLFDFSLNENTDMTALYNEINSVWNVNAHYGKQGNNVRLYGDKPIDRCEIWGTKNNRYDVFVGLETPLYSVANSLLTADWNDVYRGQKSKNEIALKGLTASDVTHILECTRIAQKETKKTVTKKTSAKKKRA